LNEGFHKKITKNQNFSKFEKRFFRRTLHLICLGQKKLKNRTQKKITRTNPKRHSSVVQSDGGGTRGVGISGGSARARELIYGDGRVVQRIFARGVGATVVGRAFISVWGG
jgi:hypothetical protein